MKLMKESKPSINLWHKPQTIKAQETLVRSKTLQDLGFSDEFINSLKEDKKSFFINIKEKIDNFKNLGFENPNRESRHTRKY